MNNETYAMTKVMVGRIKLHKYKQHKESKDIIDEVETLLTRCPPSTPPSTLWTVTSTGSRASTRTSTEAASGSWAALILVT